MHTPKHAIRRMSKGEMEFFEGRCQRMGEAKRTMWGTKWCGSGNEAINYTDLGYFSNLDSCCRTHDHCDSIPAGETKYGLTNEGKYTMMNCKCESAFEKCLRDVRGILEGKAAAAVRKTYFDLYGNGCFNVKCPSGARSARSEECTNGMATYTGETGYGAWAINKLNG
uniref:Phospholipase A2 n=1 Tax=Hottentotta tamulus TaxID=34647 RepID=PA2_HOTTA|nr:RecName: Full=Phospholipase A2; Short=MtsPLA2; Contains: RecName: Full=Large subunit; Contains: RecName: Full=Small subunit; Flags: Precursor [Mesobuthus tamulus]AAR16429.1 phospholipase A2 precursor [Mesobuthus tamulus]